MGYNCWKPLVCDGRGTNPVVANQDVTIVGVGPDVNSQFNELNVSSRTPIIELKSTYGLSDLRDVTFTTGSGTVTNDSVEYIVSTNGGATDAAILETAERGRYQAGYAAEAGIGIRLPSPPGSNEVALWGLFDSQNGLYFGQDATNGVFVGVRRAGVDTIVPQSLWNVDPLNGTGPSGFTLNTARGNIYQIVFSWYGFGVIEWQVAIQTSTGSAQEVVTVHREKPLFQTSLTDPNLPVRAEVSNNGSTGTFALYVAGRAYSILGTSRQTFRITSERRGPISVSTTPYPLISFQRKTIFPAGSGRTNSVNIRITGLDILSNGDVAFIIYVGGQVNSTFVNFPTATTNIPDNETALLVNSTSTSITTLGQVVYQGLATGGQGRSTALSASDGIDIVLPDDSIVTLAAATFSGSATVTSSFRLQENW